jgi:hypothetical protein
MLVLLRMSTGEGWNDIMKAYFTQTNCTATVTTARGSLSPCPSLKVSEFKSDTTCVQNCGSTAGALIFFDLYTAIVTHVLLKLVIAVILDSLNDLSRVEEAAVHTDVFRRFAELWSRFDPYATGYIQFSQLEYLLRRLGACLLDPYSLSLRSLV